MYIYVNVPYDVIIVEYGDAIGSGRVERPSLYIEYHYVRKIPYTNVYLRLRTQKVVDSCCQAPSHALGLLWTDLITNGTCERVLQALATNRSSELNALGSCLEVA